MRQRRRTYSPVLEPLEARDLMAASLTASHASGILTIEGTEAADRIIVRQINGRISVDGAVIKLGTNTQATIAAGVVNRIVVKGLGGDDFIHLESEQAAGQQALAMTAWLYGGEGHDTIRCGQGADWVYGGNGADTIYGNVGNDTLIGEGGSDLIYGDAGDDRIWGGTSADWLYGGDGNDALYGEDGNDSLDGGAGLDITTGGAGFDSYRDDFNLTQPFHNGARATDVIQQSAPMCATLSALAELAERGWNLPGQIVNAGNGLFDVRLRRNSGFYYERVAFNGSWNDNDPAPARDASGRNLPEFWPLLFQRARLQLYGVNYRNEMTAAQWNAANDASFGSLFDAGEALYTFTGNLAAYHYANQANPDTIAGAFRAGKPVLLVTPGSTGTNSTLDPATGIISWHVYALIDIFQQSGQWMVKLYNPWGVDGIGAAKDGVNDGFLTITWTDVAKFFRSVRVGA